jgi:hypothetical protein
MSPQKKEFHLKELIRKKMREIKMRMDRIDSIIILVFSLLLISCCQQPRDIDRNSVIPVPGQVAYQKMESIGFIHFGINTFTDREWGFGDESPGGQRGGHETAHTDSQTS